MLNHRGFSAWIETEDGVVPEFMTSVDENQNIVQCWIPGEAGQTFTVHWQDNGTKVDSIGFINLDGYTVPGRFLFGTGKTLRHGIRASPTEERPFQFQSADHTQRSSRPTARLGSIKLSIKRIARGNSRLANPIQQYPATQGMAGNDLCVGFGTNCKSYEQYQYTWDVKPYPGDNVTGSKPATYVSFVFRYRTGVFLQSQGIMPMMMKQISNIPQSQAIVERVPSGSSINQGWGQSDPSPIIQGYVPRIPSGSSVVQGYVQSPSGSSVAPGYVQSPSGSSVFHGYVQSPSGSYAQSVPSPTVAPGYGEGLIPAPLAPVQIQIPEGPIQPPIPPRRISAKSSSKKGKSFGTLGAASGEPSGSRVPSTVHRTSSGRLIGKHPDSYPQEGLICFDDDMPAVDEEEQEEQVESEPESPPMSQYTSTFSVYNWEGNNSPKY